MKRISAFFLCLTLILPLSVPAVFAASGDGAARLYGAARSMFPDKTVQSVTYRAELVSADAELTSPAGAALPTGKDKTVLSPGDSAAVRRDAVLKLSLAVSLRIPAGTDEEGGEVFTEEEHLFEVKTVWLSAGTAFTYRLPGGVPELFLLRGSLASAFAPDPLSDGALILSSRGVRVAAGEHYLAFGADEDGVGVFCFGSSGSVTLTYEGGHRKLRALEGADISRDGTVETFTSPFGDSVTDAHFSRFSALFCAVTENSALADGLSRAAEREGLELNSYRERGLEALAGRRADAARAFGTPVPEPRRVLPLTAGRFAGGELLPQEASASSSSSSCVFLYPASTGAYTVEDAGKLTDLSALADDAAVPVRVTLAVPLKDAGDTLKLVINETAFDITSTEGESTYIFSPAALDCREALEGTSGAVTAEIEYGTEKTYLFFMGETDFYEYLPADEKLPAAEEGKPYGIEIKLKNELGQDARFSLLHTCGKTEERLSPTLTAEGTYLFTVTPGKGANFLRVDTDLLFELETDNDLGRAYSVRVKNTAGGGLCAAGLIPRLEVTPFEAEDYVPLLLQESGGNSYALDPDGAGTYLLHPIAADTVVRLTLGYPVIVPEENEVFSIEPLEGFSADSAPCGGEYRFRVPLAEGVALGTSLLVKNNGVTLTPDSEGVYIIAEVTQPVRLTVTSGVTYNVFLPASDLFSVMPYGGDGTTVLENGTFRFTLQLAPTAADTQLIVAANESVLAPDHSGIYTVTGIKKDVYITVRPVTSFRVLLPEGDGYTLTPLEGSETTVLSGGTYSFTVETDASVGADSELSVTANGTPLVPVEGVYTVTDIREDIVLAVHLRRAFSVTLPAENEIYAITAEKTSVLYGDAFVFTVTPKTVGAPLTVFVNGRAVHGVGGTYTVDHVYADLFITVTVSGAAAQPCRLTLNAAPGVEVKPLSPEEVFPGSEFAFLATVSSEAGEPAVEAPGAHVTLSSETPLGTKTAYLFLVSGFSADTEISVHPANQ